MSDQALHTDLLPGNAAVLQAASTQDSDAEKSSLLHSNPGCHAGIKSHRGLAGCLDTPGTCTASRDVVSLGNDVARDQLELISKRNRHKEKAKHSMTT